MGFILSFLLGAIVASLFMHYLQKAQHKQTVRTYEIQIRTLQEQYQQLLNEAESRDSNESCANTDHNNGQRIDKEPEVEPTQPQTHSPLQHPVERECSEILQPQSRNPRPQYPNRSSQPRKRPKKSYSVEDIRKTHPRAYKPWTRSEEDRLKQCYQMGMSMDDLVTEFQRNPGGIRSRLKKMDLLK